MNTSSKTPTVALDYLGCKLNQAEIQQLARQLEAAGYTIVDPEEKADIYILNTCSVTQTADRKSRHLLRMAKRHNSSARIIATGCYAQRAPEELKNIEGVELVLDNIKKMNLAGILGYISAPKSSNGPAIQWQGKRRTRSFLKIQEGCKNFCAYCIVPYVRNRESSVPADRVIALVRGLLANSYREIVLTGTEIGAYSFSGIDLEELIRRILAETAAPHLRVSSLQPHHVSPGLIGLWKSPRLCPHFHLSLQSGSDTVLKRMNRKYTSADYCKTVGLIRGAVPDVAITTDVIAGFPGETDEEFKETVAFCREMKFARIHVFSFSPRPGTAAASMPGQVPDAVKKSRSGIMLDLAKESAREFRRSFIGRTMDVLWEQQSSGTWTGLTGNYIKVYTKSPEELTNRIGPVKLVKLYRDGVWGELSE